jgi:Centromere DNA-binding protein complex CBF3 subunit, domain 2/Transcriptional activator of glycolytic enzymes
MRFILFLPLLISSSVADLIRFDEVDTNTLYILQIRRAGKWNDDVMSTTYLSSLPRDFIRTAAGHEKGHYFVDRAQIEPPASLTNKVFPLVERDLGRYGDGSYKSSLCGQGFLRLLRYLKTVFLQDSVVLREQWPDHPNFQQPLFKTAEYRKFAAEVLAACRNPVVTYSDQLQQAVPEVVIELRAMRRELGKMTQALDGRLNRVERRQDRIERRQDRLERRQDDTARMLTSARVRYDPPPSSSPSQSTDRSSTPGTSAAAAAAAASASASAPAPAPAPAASASAPATPAASAVAASAAATTTAVATAEPQFLMDRTATTVLDIWSEWQEGRGGKPSVLPLNESRGSNWRKAYSRRKKLIDEINFFAVAHNHDPLEVAHEFEDLRLAKEKSLNWMWEVWVPEQKAARGG